MNFEVNLLRKASEEEIHCNELINFTRMQLFYKNCLPYVKNVAPTDESQNAAIKTKQIKKYH